MKRDYGNDDFLYELFLVWKRSYESIFLDLWVCFLTWLFFNMRKGYNSIFRLVRIIFYRDCKCNYFLVWMGVIGVFVGMSKNFWALRVFFLQIKKSQVANCTRSPYFTLLMVGTWTLYLENSNSDKHHTLLIYLLY